MSLVISPAPRQINVVKRFPRLLSAALCLLAVSCVHVADRRADFLKLIDRPRVALSPQVEELRATNGIAQFHFSFAADADQRVPGILMKVVDSHGRRPVVIALHGTGGSKANMLSLSRKLAEKGFITVAIDGRYHGERIKSGKGTAEYNEAIVRAWREPGEHPFYYDTVWDVMRLMDYLTTRDDVDPQRIGLVGISKGGIETYLAAAADERIAVVVPCIGVQSFYWALKNNDWQGRIGTIQPAFDQVAKESGVAKPDTAFVKKFYNRVVPGIYSEFDGPAMLSLIAPRPLLVINSDSDNHTPLPGVKACIDAAEKAYQAAGAESQFNARIQQNTAHQVKPESERAAIDWFVKWLKP
jgi:dienelactone hydrolase